MTIRVHYHDFEQSPEEAHNLTEDAMLTFKVLESTLLEIGRHLTYRSLKISDLFG